MPQVKSHCRIHALFLSVFTAGVTLASFPVEKPNHNTEKVSTISEKKAKKIEKANEKMEKKVAKLKAKIEKKAAKQKANRGGGNDMVLLVLAAISLFIPFAWHNWYLERYQKALIQTILTLLVVTALISWIWQIVDFVRIFQGNY